MRRSTPTVEDVLFSHMEARKKIVSDIETMKKNNDDFIGQLGVMYAGNENVIREQDALQTKLEEELASLNVSSGGSVTSGKKQTKSLHIAQTPQDTETTALEVENQSLVDKKNDMKTTISRTKTENGKLETQIGKSKSELGGLESDIKNFDVRSTASTTEKSESLANLNSHLNSVKKDFDEESRSVDVVKKLLKTSPGPGPTTHDLAKYKASPPFRVVQTAFMVGGQENHDSNNGFHELSARIANLARQINRVTAV